MTIRIGQGHAIDAEVMMMGRQVPRPFQALGRDIDPMTPVRFCSIHAELTQKVTRSAAHVEDAPVREWPESFPDECLQQDSFDSLEQEQVARVSQIIASGENRLIPPAESLGNPENHLIRPGQ
jgi:hypothetical protein